MLPPPIPHAALYKTKESIWPERTSNNMSVGGVFLFNFIFLFENAYSWFTVQVSAAELGQAKDRSLKVHLGLSPVCASRWTIRNYTWKWS